MSYLIITDKVNLFLSTFVRNEIERLKDLKREDIYPQWGTIE